VHGLSTSPTSTDTPQSGWTRQRFADPSGVAPVEAISVSGAGHSLPMTGMAQYALQFFGLTSGGTTSPPPSDSTCRVTYTANTWNSGFTADITITSTTAVSGWNLTWTRPGNQQVTNAWNATMSQSGTQVTARNAPYNATIAAGATTTFGLQATLSSRDMGTALDWRSNGRNLDLATRQLFTVLYY
jgi:cellulase/cellobiase CelA1